MGQAALLTVAFVIVFFVTGLPWIWATGFVVGGSLIGGGLYLLLPHVRFRINSFLNPDAHDTFQIDIARMAIERGGMFGVGPGEGRVKRILPDAHTDFIFAVTAEEFGIVVCMVLVLLFAIIVLRALFVAQKAEDPFIRLAVTGLHSGDWQKSYTRRDSNGHQSYVAGRFLVDWEASDRLKFSLNVNGWRDKSQPQAQQLIATHEQVNATGGPAGADLCSPFLTSGD